jgi:hypothetical protein
MNRPATLWFWKDWESEVALKDCSLAAQGLWMRMLCIAAQHDPIGYVSIGSVGLSADRIARIVGAEVQEIERLIGELSLNGVFSRDRNGTIYNRRMVRDAKKAKVARRNGKLGGNPMLTCRTQTPHPGDHELPKSPPDVNVSKTKQNSSSVKGQDKGGLKTKDKLKPIPIPLEDSSLRSESIPPNDASHHHSPHGSAGGPPKMGQRLDDNWQPCERSLEICLAMGYSREFLTGEALDSFRDYWLGIPGQKGRKLDWERTFCNRMREHPNRVRLTGKTVATSNGHRGPITAFSRPSVGDKIAAFEQSAAKNAEKAARLRAEIEADKQKTLELENGKLRSHR